MNPTSCFKGHGKCEKDANIVTELIFLNYSFDYGTKEIGGIRNDCCLFIDNFNSLSICALPSLLTLFITQRYGQILSIVT